MNWLAIVVLIFLAIYIVRGYHNGFIKTVISMFTVVLALFIAYVGTSFLSGFLQENETIYNTVNSKVIEVMKIDTEAKSAVDQQEYIESLPVPERLKNELEENNNSKIYELMDTSRFADYVAGYITCSIIKAISFVILFIALLIVIRIVAHILDIVSHLPVLNTINKLGGMAVGLVHGLVVLWVLCIVAMIYSATGPGIAIFEAIDDSAFLTCIYNNNLLIHFVSDIARSLL